MKDAVEIVARAIGPALLEPAPNYSGPVDPLVPMRRVATAALRALEEAGLVLVPTKLTDSMWHAAADSIGNDEAVEDIWRAMLDAAGGEAQ